MRLRVIYVESEDGERFAFVILIEPGADGIFFELLPQSEVEREELPA